MREDFLAEALQEVSDEHIMEATLPLRKKKRKRSWRGFAACFAVLAVCSFFAGRFFVLNSAMGGSAESESMVEGESVQTGQYTEEGAMTEDSITYPVDGSGDTYGSGSATEYTEIGIMLAAQDVTPTGLTLVCSRDGGFTDAEIISGSWYTVEQREGDTWAELPYLLDNVGWTEEGWIIAPDTSTEWAVDWEWLYGELSAGEYRIGKEFMISHSPGDYEKTVLYAEFFIR